MVHPAEFNLVQAPVEAWNPSLLLSAQKEALERAINGAPLDDVLNILVHSAAKQAGGRAAIFLVDQTKAFLRFSAASGLPESYTRAVDGFLIGPTSPSCGNAAYTGKRVIVSDVREDPSWQPFLALANEHGIRACWSSLIRGFDGEVLGTLAVYHDAPREPDNDILEAIDLLAQTACVLIALARADGARDAAFEHAQACDLAAREMSHRIMNSFQVMDSLVSMQANASTSVEVHSALVGVSGRLHSISSVHRLLLKGLRENVETIELAEYLPALVDFVGSAFTIAGVTTLEADVEAGLRLTAGQVSNLGLIATELVMNALKYASPDGLACHVKVSTRRVGDMIRLSVADDGIGLPPQSEQADKIGLGMQLIFSLARQLGGTVEIDRRPPGVCFSVSFPVAAAAEDA